MTYDVSELVPHSGDMSLLSEIVKFDDDSLHAEAVIGANNPFLIEGRVSSWIGIEYMAQSIAAWAGVRALDKDEKIKLGFLVGTRKYQSDIDYFNLGDTLKISIHCELNSEVGLSVFYGELYCRDKVATANISVFQPANVEEFLDGSL